MQFFKQTRAVPEEGLPGAAAHFLLVVQGGPRPRLICGRRRSGAVPLSADRHPSVVTMPRITLKYLAAELGTHPSIISRVIRNVPDARVSEAKRQRILALVRATGYRPHHAGRSLRNRSTQILALIVPDVANPFYARLFRSVENTARMHGYNVILCNTDEDSDRFRDLIETLGAGHVDGWLVASAGGVDGTVPLLDNSGIPYVLLNRRSKAPHVPWVGPDDFATGKKGATHLLDLGHRRIAYVTAHLTIESMRQRFNGFRRAMAHRGISVRDELLVVGYLDQAIVRARTRAILRLPARRRPTAVFVSNSLSLDSVLDCIREEGMHVPKDISVVGYNTFDEARVTGVLVPVVEIGRIATDWLIAATGESATAQTIRVTLPVGFVDRGTTLPPRPSAGSSN
jgi:LacI family transcriptional regulator, galactose operon repressor